MSNTNFILAAGNAPAATPAKAAPAKAAPAKAVTEQPATAPGAKPQQPGLLDGLGSMFPFILIIVVMFFLMNRSQKKEQRRRQEMLDALKKGDEVVTAGGIHGKIAEIKEDVILLEIAENVKISINKAAVSAPKTAPAAEEPKK